MQEEEPLPSGCRVLLSIRILSLSSPEVVRLVQKSSSSFISVQLRRGKKLSSAIDQFRIDEDGTSLVFSVSLTMCAVLFGDGWGRGGGVGVDDVWRGLRVLIGRVLQ